MRLAPLLILAACSTAHGAGLGPFDVRLYGPGRELADVRRVVAWDGGNLALADGTVIGTVQAVPDGPLPSALFTVAGSASVSWDGTGTTGQLPTASGYMELVRPASEENRDLGKALLWTTAITAGTLLWTVYRDAFWGRGSPESF